MSTQARHRGCTQDCPHYTSFLKILDVETPEGFAGKQAKLEKLSSVPQVTIETVKVLCILDPTRRERSYENTFSSASWITVNGLPLEVVEGVLGCKGLEGYVFPVLGVKNAIRIYDWVSVTGPFFSGDSPLTRLNKGIRDVLLLPRTGEQMHGGVLDLGDILRPASRKTFD